MKRLFNYLPAIGFAFRRWQAGLIFGTCLLLVVSGKPAFGENLPKQDIQISPILQNLTLTPGETVSFPVIIENLADKPLGIHVDIFPFNPGNPELTSGSNELSLTGFTTVSDSDIILDKTSRKTIYVSITVPQNTQEGGYYETLAYTPLMSNAQNIHSPIVLSKFLGFVFVSVGHVSLQDAAKQVTIIDFKPKAYIVDHGQETMSFTVQNKYKTHVIGKPFLTITPLFEKPESFLLDEKYLFPGFSRTWEKQLALPMHIFYKATLTLSVGQGNTISATTWFILLPYKFVLACGIGLLLICITLLRKRIYRALAILLHG